MNILLFRNVAMKYCWAQNKQINYHKLPLEITFFHQICLNRYISVSQQYFWTSAVYMIFVRCTQYTCVVYGYFSNVAYWQSILYSKRGTTCKWCAVIINVIFHLILLFVFFLFDYFWARWLKYNNRWPSIRNLSLQTNKTNFCIYFNM